MRFLRQLLRCFLLQDSLQAPFHGCFAQCRVVGAHREDSERCRGAKLQPSDRLLPLTIRQLDLHKAPWTTTAKRDRESARNWHVQTAMHVESSAMLPNKGRVTTVRYHRASARRANRGEENIPESREWMQNRALLSMLSF
jgi:hypothetical protein